MTGMPDWTISSVWCSERSPPSSFTAPTPASLTRRVALRRACTAPSWYDPNGMSPMTSARLVPRTTAADSMVIWSIVTGTVLS